MKLNISDGVTGKEVAIRKLWFVSIVTDMAAYVAGRPAIGELYKKRMGKHFPAMTLVEVKSLPFPEAKVEIQGVAVI